MYRANKGTHNMAYTFDDCIFSDLYKEVHGVRPRHHEYNDAADARKQEIWEDLIVQHEAEIIESAKQELDAQRQFELRVTQVQQMGAEDRDTAIRWILDAEGIEAYDAAYGGTSLCYYFGMNYMFTDMFEMFCQEMFARDGNPYTES
jgi:hypothetical protein